MQREDLALAVHRVAGQCRAISEQGRVSIADCYVAADAPALAALARASVVPDSVILNADSEMLRHLLPGFTLGTALRAIPSIDRLVNSPEALPLIATAGRDLVLAAYRDVTAEWRRTAAAKANANTTNASTADVDAGATDAALQEALHHAAATRVEAWLAPSLQAVLNLTGTVLHTNLGRAPMPPACLDAMQAVASGACNLEFDLARGKRGDRDAHVEAWLCRLTGAEAATVVNNNAAAVLLALNSLALDQPVAISRGELVEIGGSFRMPDIIERAGCRLHEVGTTNRTHQKDYQAAMDAGAALLLRVHTSNYEVQGFTASVSDAALASLARAGDGLFVNDLGSGALVDMSAYGLPAELTVQQAIAEGANVVTFSGDKLLGGPQCGMLVGDRRSIDRIRRNPMKRALRCDKLTIAALEVILRMYTNPAALSQQLPALRLLTRSTADIESMAARLLPDVAALLQHEATVTTAPCHSQIGSGALPVDTLPGCALVLQPHTPTQTSADKRSAKVSGQVVERLAARLRQLPLPVIGRIHQGCVWLDLRCLENPQALLDTLAGMQPKGGGAATAAASASVQPDNPVSY